MLNKIIIIKFGHLYFILPERKIAENILLCFNKQHIAFAVRIDDAAAFIVIKIQRD